jgi:uncharacterized protein (DUF1684 family)
MERYLGYPISGRRKKTYRIFSGRRFTAFLLIVFASVLLVGFAFAEKPIRAAEAREYVRVEVHAGDTLWRIAAKYRSEDQDIRRLIYDICKINGLSADDMRAGKMILVPTLSDSDAEKLSTD